MLKLLALASVVTLAFCCTDKVDNVLAANDCGSAGTAAKFSDVKMMTYDTKGNPVCKKNSDQTKFEGDIQFPGVIKIASGSVTINGANKFPAGTQLDFSFEKLHSPLIGKLCEDGKSANFIMPDKYCHFDFCTLIGADFCTQLNKGGTFKIEDFPQLSKPIQIPALTGPLSILAGIAKGEWSFGASIKDGSTVVACGVNPDVDIE